MGLQLVWCSAWLHRWTSTSPRRALIGSCARTLPLLTNCFRSASCHDPRSHLAPACSPCHMVTVCISHVHTCLVDSCIQQCIHTHTINNIHTHRYAAYIAHIIMIHYIYTLCVCVCIPVCVCLVCLRLSGCVSARERKLGCLRLRLACIHSAEADAFHTYRYVLFPTRPFCPCSSIQTNSCHAPVMCSGGMLLHITFAGQCRDCRRAEPPQGHSALAAAFKRTHVMLLLCAQVACCFISPLPANAEIAAVRSHMVSYTLASGIVHRMNELFSLFDRPQVPAAHSMPFGYILAALLQKDWSTTSLFLFRSPCLCALLLYSQT